MLKPVDGGRRPPFFRPVPGQLTEHVLGDAAVAVEDVPRAHHTLVGQLCELSCVHVPSERLGVHDRANVRVPSSRAVRKKRLSRPRLGDEGNGHVDHQGIVVSWKPFQVHAHESGAPPLTIFPAHALIVVVAALVLVPAQELVVV